MRKPTIHINGTDAQSLFDGYYAALKAVQGAHKALAECAPNGRDYYTQLHTPLHPKDPVGEAMDEHRQRLAWLESIEHDLDALVTHIMEHSKVGS
jgi:hypothetical protein